MNKQPLPRLAFKQNEAAQVLGVSDKTLREWMNEPDPPPSFRRNGVLLFPHDALVEWMRRQTESENENNKND